MDLGPVYGITGSFAVKKVFLFWPSYYDMDQPSVFKGNLLECDSVSRLYPL